MTLHDWTTELGPYQVAEILDVKPNTVYMWKWRKTLPTSLKMREIVKVTKGLVSYEEMIEDFAKFNQIK